ncbi:hypothetical protein ES705_14107 [subsurface metagenome]
MTYHCRVIWSGFCSNPAMKTRNSPGAVVKTPRGVMVLSPNQADSCDLVPATCGFFTSWKEECRRYQDTRQGGTPPSTNRRIAHQYEWT